MMLHISAALGLSSEDDWNTLKSAQWFALGGIGVAGTTSKEDKAFRSLLEEPNAISKLKALLSEANLAGQCYALLGLYLCVTQLIRRTPPLQIERCPRENGRGLHDYRATNQQRGLEHYGRSI
jgi:hypothetical protein